VADRRRRVERALDVDLAAGDVTTTAGERAMLRAQARAVDVAERNADPDQVTTATHGYLELRRAVGLTGAELESVDTFEQLLAELSAPRMGDAEDS
jgi:hypothetical protein